ncbi:MAG: cyclic nucleotide-binding domain-containing protein [Nitratireductor sp.]
MALDDDIGILAGVGIFREFTQDQLRLLAFGTERLRRPAGKEIYREGAAADCAFVVVEGTVALFREREGERIIVGRIGAGSVMGELALISSGYRLTGAMAESEVELMRLNRSLFQRILVEYPDAAAKLHRRLSADLTGMLERIERLAPKFS